VDPHDPLREQAVLNDALEAVRRTAGMDLRIVPHAPPFRDALLEVDAPTTRAQFVAAIKTARNFATIGWSKSD
jgi:hypothetical protein